MVKRKSSVGSFDIGFKDGKEAVKQAIRKFESGKLYCGYESETMCLSKEANRIIDDEYYPKYYNELEQFFKAGVMDFWRVLSEIDRYWEGVYSGVMDGIIGYKKF